MSKKIAKNKTVELSNLQKQHQNGEINLYQPIEAYSEKWVHETDDDGNFVKAYPVPGTRKRADLPPIATQWQQDYQNRYCKDKRNGKSSRNR
tara:strand:+ start:1397 stop:1672 length:276 start_codon:yes stop_codon:yes gene_type:complete